MRMVHGVVRVWMVVSGVLAAGGGFRLFGRGVGHQGNRAAVGVIRVECVHRSWIV